MYIALNSDGTYKVYKNINKVYRHINDIQYLILKNFTSLKGPSYTIIEASNIKFEHGDVEVEIGISYECVDCPCTDNTTIKSTITIDNIERYYSIHPLIKQMMYYNYFMDNFMYDGPTIDITDISLYNHKFEIELNSSNMNDQEIDSVFKNLHMNTCVSKVTKYTRFLILKDGDWYVSKKIPKSFDYLGIEIIGAETLYLLTEKQYYAFASIKNLSILLKDDNIYDDIYYNDVINSREVDEILDFSTDKLSLILQACIYLPQMLVLEHTVYNNTVSLDIIVDTDNLTYNLKITEKEASDGICLFDILNKLLNI